MKKKSFIILIISVISVSILFVCGAYAKVKADRAKLFEYEANEKVYKLDPKVLEEYTTLEGGTGNARIYDESDLIIVPFSYHLKEKYSSFSEVVAEAKAFKEYAEYYFCCVSKTEGPAAFAYEKEEDKYIALLEELRRLEFQFVPTEKDKRSGKEELLTYYVYLHNSTEDEVNSDEGKRRMSVLEEYRSGNIDLDEAIVKSGVLAFLRRYLDNNEPERYNAFLDNFYMRSWFNLDDYK